MEISAIIEHVIISLIGWLLGVIIGGLVSRFLARRIQSILTSYPNVRKPAILLPWRTLLMAVILHAALPFLILLQFGFGLMTGILSIGLATFLMMLIFATPIFIGKEFHMSSVSQLLSGVRTLATVAVVWETFIGNFGGGGIGFAASTHIRLLHYSMATKYYFTIIVIILIIDVLLGIVQFIYTTKQPNPARN